MKLWSNQRGISKVAVIVAVFVLIAVAGLVGWQIGHENSGGYGSDTASNNPAESAVQSAAEAVDSDVKELVSYTVPQGWTEKTCPNAPDVVLLVPPNTEHDCASDQTAPITISIDAQNRTDCNQLQNVQNVSKHVCVSVFIDDHKTLKAETIYNQQSNYKENTRFATYYIDTGKGVVKFEYVDRVDNPDDDFQEEFDRLVGSAGVKNGHQH